MDNVTSGGARSAGGVPPKWGLGVYPQRKGLRGFCKTFRPRKVFERMDTKKPQFFPPLGGRLLQYPCAKKHLVEFGKIFAELLRKSYGYNSGGIGWGARAERRRFSERSVA